jgi:hypothetical protein
MNSNQKGCHLLIEDDTTVDPYSQFNRDPSRKETPLKVYSKLTAAIVRAFLYPTISLKITNRTFKTRNSHH